MNSLVHRHLLEHLGSLYGAGMLPGKRSSTALNKGSDAPDKLGEASLHAPVRVPVADVTANDIVLADPQDGSVREIAVRGRLRGSGPS